ncbi:hypothetical protein D3C71_1556720 [compost metagenome]
MPSLTPKLRAVMADRLPPICISMAQPCCQPYCCSMLSTIMCVVPDWEGELIITWPMKAGSARLCQLVGTGSRYFSR